MATWQMIDREPRGAASATVLEPRSVLLALDGDAPAVGAVALARWLTERREAELRVIHVTRGSPVSALAEAANATDVDLVITGVPPSAGYTVPVDDLLLRVLRRSTRPVVAVTDRMRVPPRCCVAALDFTRSSLHAARVALALLAPEATLVLAHVQPQLDAADATLRSVYAHGIAAAFDGIRQELRAPAGIRIVPALLDGNPGAALAALCDRTGADLLAMGTTRPDAFRLNRARLSTRFLRVGHPSLVLAPPAARAVNSPFDD